jgi:hypothetical protein
MQPIFGMTDREDEVAHLLERCQLIIAALREVEQGGAVLTQVAEIVEQTAKKKNARGLRSIRADLLEMSRHLLPSKSALRLKEQLDAQERDDPTRKAIELESPSQRREHPARITWSEAQARVGLPKLTETIDPAWIEGTMPRQDEGWSLICRFERRPDEQGNPSDAFVRFLVADAPESALHQGARLQLFERGTGQYAEVEILR